ncbi:cobalamin B12-binding domain protein [Oscillochloris trichoides DG-6]|uniref:Cobalamin B12-binding domain protein n=1 Tax=Oscillochloris trichoides DG-6 TaxID=765420 RepID=E1IFR4_9CHLR|nr:cobalamin-dependent protein [Oscillochloris trichoides]EFO79955.1 cobalamin B12-binding domain protein [Oscillochloris trichoides DG-6]
MSSDESLSPQATDEFLQALLASDRFAVRRIITNYADLTGPFSVIEQLIVPSLEQIGHAWDKGEISLAQVYMSGRICEEMIETILPPASSQRINQPPIAVAVLDDYHMLGKRMITSALRASGYEIHDYGRVDVDRLVKYVITDKIAIVLISVLMLPSALEVLQIRQRLDRVGLHPFIVVGGAPFRFDAQLWQEIGADAMGRSTSDAVTIVSKLLKDLL